MYWQQNILFKNHILNLYFYTFLAITYAGIDLYPLNILKNKEALINIIFNF